MHCQDQHVTTKIRWLWSTDLWSLPSVLQHAAQGMNLAVILKVRDFVLRLEQEVHGSTRRPSYLAQQAAKYRRATIPGWTQMIQASIATCLGVPGHGTEAAGTDGFEETPPIVPLAGQVDEEYLKRMQIVKAHYQMSDEDFLGLA